MFGFLIRLASSEDELPFIPGIFFLNQVGVIKAVRNSLDSSEEVTALWVTHRLEELEYADGAVYMENGEIVMQGDPTSIMDFIRARQSAYIKQIST